MGHMPLLVRLSAAFLGAVALLAPTHAVADGRPEPAARPQLLAHAGHGAAVVSALGDRLPAAAAVNQMSTTKLRTILANDPTAWLGADGHMFYVEEAEALPQADLTPGTATATYPESQTFALHSLPGSTHKIFLDFDGADVSGTWWNTPSAYNPTPMPSRHYTGFTLDGDAAFSSAEKAYIQTVWRIVAEKYAPFDADVTTQDPGPAGYNRSDTSDATYGDHVLITDDSGAVLSACGGSCSGVALLDTFDSVGGDYLEPAWVFSSKTWDSPVLTAHTVAHEVGHTFGLSHDGITGGTSYYAGQGNWFPLMGSSINAVGQFSKGEYANANNTQDDLAIIATHGAPYRSDDHSDVVAEPLTGGTVVDGVISTRTDRDLFAVDHACTTNLTARATGVGAGASLDLSVTVLDSAGQVVGYNDPASGQVRPPGSPAVPTGMDASVTVAAANAVYYVRVDGVGKGDARTTGYSDYASLGEYQLAVSACDGGMPVPTTPTMPVTTTPTSTVSVPWMPRIGTASSGRAGGASTATARWSAPASNGGSAIRGYQVKALRLSASGRVTKVLTSARVSSGARALKMRLPKGRYRFRVVAFNAAGASPLSVPSRVVRAR
jgi:hypothetical protein